MTGTEFLWLLAALGAAYLLGRTHQYKSDQKKVQGNLKNLL